MTTKRRYTHAQKTAAVVEAETNGLTQAAAKTGIPLTTIDYWLDKPEFVALRSKTREERRDGYRVLVARAQEELLKRVTAMEPRDLTILLGVAQDKELLLSGDATSRSEVNTFNGYNDHEKRAIADVLRQAIAADGPSAGVEGDAGGVAVDGAGETGADSAGG